MAVALPAGLVHTVGLAGDHTEIGVLPNWSDFMACLSPSAGERIMPLSSGLMFWNTTRIRDKIGARI
jgi:hypothetical protein